MPEHQSPAHHLHHHHNSRTATPPREKPSSCEEGLFQIGNEVACRKSGVKGRVRYYGSTSFAEGRWVGIEIEQEGRGKNDGSVGGVRYFSCPPSKGLFVKPEAVEIIHDHDSTSTSTTTTKDNNYKDKGGKEEGHQPAAIITLPSSSSSSSSVKVASSSHVTNQGKATRKIATTSSTIHKTKQPTSGGAMNKAITTSSPSSSTTSRAAAGEVPRKSKKQSVSYYVYNKLVGEADGGRELEKDEFSKLLSLYHSSWGDQRVYVHWRNKEGRECVRVKGPCFCFCGHLYKSHAWFDVSVACRVPGCLCERYQYLHRQGSWFLQCRCKHGALDHHDKGRASGCHVAGCGCPAFTTNFACVCGQLWADHSTVADTEGQRREEGRPVDPDVVKRRLEVKRQEKAPGCGQCMACKCLMPNCRKGKGKYQPKEFL